MHPCEFFDADYEAERETFVNKQSSFVALISLGSPDKIIDLKYKYLACFVFVAWSLGLLTSDMCLMWESAPFLISQHRFLPLIGPFCLRLLQFLLVGKSRLRF